MKFVLICGKVAHTLKRGEFILLDAENSEKNACRMEHAMDKNAIDRLVQF